MTDFARSGDSTGMTPPRLRPATALHSAPIIAVLALVAPGCDSDSEEISATASDSNSGTSSASSSETDSATSGDSNPSGDSQTTATASDTATTSDTTSDSGSETSVECSETSVPPVPCETDTDIGSETDGITSCEEVFEEGACGNNELFDCGWFPTTHVVVGGPGEDCEDIGLDEGYCLQTDRLDSGCPGAFDSTCPDGVTTVFYREAGLEIGAVELLVHGEDESCDGPSGDFLPCLMIDDGGEITFEPPECGCACPG